MNAGLDLLAVAAGGSLGAVARYSMLIAVDRSPLVGWIGGGPAWATTFANLLGCLALGVLFQLGIFWAEADNPSGLSPRTLLLIRVGILGSLTTFSTLIGESATLSADGKWTVGLLLILLNVAAGWTLFWGGAASVKWIGA